MTTSSRHEQPQDTNDLYERLFACQADAMLAISEYELTEEECGESGVHRLQASIGTTMRELAAAYQHRGDLPRVAHQVVLLEQETAMVIRSIAKYRQAHFVDPRRRFINKGMEVAFVPDFGREAIEDFRPVRPFGDNAQQ